MKEMDNLTRDVLAAEAAGYGPWYGRYIADHGHTLEPEPPKIEKKTAVCALCGKTFIRVCRGPAKYCSVECRDDVRRRRDAAYRKRKMAACAASPG